MKHSKYIDAEHGDIVILADLKIDIEFMIRHEYTDQVEAIAPNGAIMRNLEGNIDLVCAWWRTDGIRMTWIHSRNIKDIKKWNEVHRQKHQHNYQKSEDRQLRICLGCKQIQTREAYEDNDQYHEVWITRELTVKPKKIKITEFEKDDIVFDDYAFLDSMGISQK